MFQNRKMIVLLLLVFATPVQTHALAWKECVWYFSKGLKRGVTFLENPARFMTNYEFGKAVSSQLNNPYYHVAPEELEGFEHLDGIRKRLILLNYMDRSFAVSLRVRKEGGTTGVESGVIRFLDNSNLQLSGQN